MFGWWILPACVSSPPYFLLIFVASINRAFSGWSWVVRWVWSCRLCLRQSLLCFVWCYRSLFSLVLWAWICEGSRSPLFNTPDIPVWLVGREGACGTSKRSCSVDHATSPSDIESLLHDGKRPLLLPILQSIIYTFGSLDKFCFHLHPTFLSNLMTYLFLSCCSPCCSYRDQHKIKRSISNRKLLGGSQSTLGCPRVEYMPGGKDLRFVSGHKHKLPRDSLEGE